jgi:cysteine-rich repeat protein
MKITARSAFAVAAACLLLPFVACTGGDGSEADAGRPDIFGADTDDTGGAVEDTAVDSGVGDTEADSVADTDPTDTALDTTTDTVPADTAVDTTADTSGPPICGNGTIEAGEACDDGNRLAGDGCSFNCTLECGPGNDSDFDGICNASDVCAGFDDNLDVNANGIPDGCEGSPELCADLIDNDLDGATDCADTECSLLPVCSAVPPTETDCSDGIDNDLDRYADCLDLDCIGDPACGAADGAGSCASPRVITGPGIYDGSTIGLSDVVRPGCAFEAGGADEVFTFRPATAGAWCLWVTDANFDTVLNVRRGCSNAGAEVTCNDDGPTVTTLLSQAEPTLDTTTNYFVFVGGSLADEFGDFRLFVRPGSCPATLTESCANGLDDDADGLVDCDDTSCATDANCVSLPEICNDSRDNDRDGLTDCADTADCATDVDCIVLPEVCNDSRDNDRDGLTDCADTADCSLDANCIVLPEVCDDGLDNDRDRATDCADTADCAASPLCAEVCDDGVDNNRNSLVDCLDPLCTASPLCAEDCIDGIDNNRDGLVDCLDPLCATAPACLPPTDGTCTAPNLITGAGTYTGDTTGASDLGRTGCSTGAGGLDEVWSVTVPTSGDWCFIITEATFDTTLYMTNACLTTSSLITCDANDGPSTWSMAQAPLTAGRTVFLSVDGNTATAFGTYRLLVQSGACPATLPEYCDNRVDDDADGATDCTDTDCTGNPACGPQPEICDDAFDNDLDGLEDCSDTDCSAATVCIPVPELCADARDNDLDTFIDCFDPDCAGDVACLPPAEICADAIDNDRDGLIDCSDPDCVDAINCIPFPEVCTDGRDNDLDTLVDCADPDCAAQLVCIASPEVCNDGRDNDLDGDIDCDDSQCTSTDCTPTGNGSCSTPTAIGSFGTFTGTTSFSNREGSCGGLGREEAIRWRAPLTGNICVQLEGRANFDAVLYARTSCTTDTTELACSDDVSETSYGARIDLAVTNASSYFLFADTYGAGDSGTWNLTISRGTCAEVYGSEASCTDGLDNDTDGFIDCADADCATDPACL